VENLDADELLQFLNARYPHDGLEHLQSEKRAIMEGTMLSGIKSIHPDYLLK
jgi:hypothetical protein